MLNLTEVYIMTPTEMFKYLVIILISAGAFLALVLWTIVLIEDILLWSKKRRRFRKANPGFYPAQPETVLRRQIQQEMDRSKEDMIFVADEWHKLKRPFINLNDFEYEMQEVLAKHFDQGHTLLFYKNGKKYKIVFDETERMVQEVVDE